MADEGLYLLDVTIRPCAYLNDVIKGSWTSLQEGSQKGNGKIVYGFKVVGENRLLTVLEGGVESAVSSLNAAHGELVVLKCIPVRTCEGFAKSVLGVDDSLTQILPRKLGLNGRIFFLHFVIEYKGKTVTELIGAWKREAEKVLGLRCSEDIEHEVYKVVAQREVRSSPMQLLMDVQVIVFMKVPDAGITDDISFTLPIMKEMGDQVHITTKEVMPLS